MSRRINFHASALTEAAETAAWYELEQAGLGARFESAVNAALDILEAEILPLSSWPGSAGRNGVKHIVLRRFPFSIVVHERADELLVLAIAHHARRPGYWLARLST